MFFLNRVKGKIEDIVDFLWVFDVIFFVSELESGDFFDDVCEFLFF